MGRRRARAWPGLRAAGGRAVCRGGRRGYGRLAYAMLARCELDLGRYDAAVSAHQQALRAFDRRFHLRWYVWSWTAALWAHGYRGRWAEAHAAGAAALQAGEEFGDRGAVSETARDLALLCLQQGDQARALTYAQQAADTAASPVDRQIVAGVQALVACHLGQASAAPPILRALAAGLRDMGYSTPAIVTGVHLAE